MKKKLIIIVSSISGVMLTFVSFIVIIIMSLLSLIILPKMFQYQTAKEISENSNLEYELLSKVKSVEYFENSTIITGWGTYGAVSNSYIDENGVLKEDHVTYNVSAWPYFFSFNNRITSINCYDKVYKIFGIGIGDSIATWNQVMKENGFEVVRDEFYSYTYKRNSIRIIIGITDGDVIDSYNIYIDPPVFLLRLISDTVEEVKDR